MSIFKQTPGQPKEASYCNGLLFQTNLWLEPLEPSRTKILIIRKPPIQDARPVIRDAIGPLVSKKAQYVLVLQMRMTHYVYIYIYIFIDPFLFWCEELEVGTALYTLQK